MASFTEMNPMYATIQENPPDSHSPLPSVASHRDTATSQTALLNPYDRPERGEAAATSGHPSSSKRLDAENTIYGKAPPEEKEKKVANLVPVDYHSRGGLWTGIQSCAFLVFPALVCVFAAAVLILTLLIAFGVLPGEQMTSLNRALDTLESLNQTLAGLQAQLDSMGSQNMTGACPNSTSPPPLQPNATSPPLPATSSLLFHTVNFSDCVQFTSSCNFSASSPCTTGPNSTTPAFLQGGSTTTSVTVELSCWVSAGGNGASAVFLVANSTLANSTLQCQCSGSDKDAVCNFYRMECQVPVVEVVTTQQDP